jgi:hypothetical protein
MLEFGLVCRNELRRLCNRSAPSAYVKGFRLRWSVTLVDATYPRYTILSIKDINDYWTNGLNDDTSTRIMDGRKSANAEHHKAG